MEIRFVPPADPTRRWANKEYYLEDITQRANHIGMPERIQRIRLNIPRLPNRQRLQLLQREAQDAGKAVVLGGWQDCIFGYACLLVLPLQGGEPQVWGYG